MQSSGLGGKVKYFNREMKVDQIIAYFNQKKINLIPPFQRGTVWTLALRQRLMLNMIQARPIPAVFLYKEAAGAQFAYNILDGKQRLESLILFVGDKRPDLHVENVRDYFYGSPSQKHVNFEIELDGKALHFEKVDDEIVRSFREYAIPTIEIDLDDESTGIDEIVNLFIDINQQGVKVSRFDVVKALGKDPLFRQIFDLIAIKQVRRKTVFYKAKNCPYIFVLKRLRIVTRLKDRMSQIDRIWERLTEIALFMRTQKHRAPAEILKAFIRDDNEENSKLSPSELRKLRGAFEFLQGAYRKHPTLMVSKLATDQPEFYTVVTSLLSTDLLTRYAHADLAKKLVRFDEIAQGDGPTSDSIAGMVEEFKKLSEKQTTHPRSREERQKLFYKVLESIK
jgi:hypothetical protein